MQQIGPQELRSWLDENGPLLLDVREPWEVECCALPGSVHMRMSEIPTRWAELEATRPVVCICHHGGRSLQVALYLEQRGFRDVFNLAGGIDAWAREIDPTLPRY